MKVALVLGINKTLQRLNLELQDIQDAMRFGLDNDTYTLYEAREKLAKQKIADLTEQLKQIAE